MSELRPIDEYCSECRYRRLRSDIVTKMDVIRALANLNIEYTTESWKLIIKAIAEI